MSIQNLKNILSRMKVSQRKPSLPKQIESSGNSKIFDYATNKKNGVQLQMKQLEKWNELAANDMKMTRIQIPLNRFEEMIQWTEEGKLWRYPIDNEQGMDEEKNVPFEDHVFLDEYLEDFPKNEHIQTFMEYVISGLAKNNWMTVDRKRNVIKFYKDYFDKKRDLYKAAGFELE